MCLWCYSECVSKPSKLKNLPDHSGNRTRDLWFARLDFIAQLGKHWTSKPKVAGPIPTVALQIFQLARCGYTLTVTPETRPFILC